MTSVAQANPAVLSEPQIVHEAIDERQHVRAKIPAKVRLRGKTGEINCELCDLSLGGVGVHTAAPLKEGMLFDGEVIIPLSTVDIKLDVKLKVVKVRSDIIGLAYMDLPQAKRDVLRHIMSAYLSGDVVDIDGVLNVMQRENYIKQRKVKSGDSRTWGSRIKSILGTLLYLVMGLSILAFLAYKVYLYLFEVKSSNAFVAADTYSLYMPDNGFIEFLLPPGTTQVKKGEPIASISSQLASSITTPADLEALAGMSEENVAAILGRSMIETVISSPCDCELVYVNGSDNRYGYKGDQLIDLLPVDKPLYIKASFPSQKLADLRNAKTAKVQVYGEEQSYSAEIISANYRKEDDLLEVKLATDRQLAAKAYNAPANVSLFKDVSL
ncbi:PilZ domain-containing protein [Gilvimarinus sp. DA14]|uniref:PilZ domain-containing protein n=1 Tax=Gilvimarinus sp. DA14 TaxID=2956798 RepID=UPI0020B6EAEE|nr:PilZ domain-containing protein [Gilvimarinus sp. DA14]UTF59853.1 PilZ domain-containing protein [Gilvimarinus sp. DA14]